MSYFCPDPNIKLIYINTFLTNSSAKGISWGGGGYTFVEEDIASFYTAYSPIALTLVNNMRNLYQFFLGIGLHLLHAWP